MTSYNYAANVRPPKSIGMSPDGTLSALGNDITGLIAYTQLLVEGSGKASSTGKPMGNKYFLKTPGTCQAIDTGETEDRYIFINNIPMGNIPFISESIGGNFSTFRGLIPGMFSDMEVFNPVTIIKGFRAGSMPQCRAINMQTVDVNNNVGSETQYVADVDIEAIDPCLFPNKNNPVTNKGCIEVFSNIQNTYFQPDEIAPILSWNGNGIGKQRQEINISLDKVVIIFVLTLIYFFVTFIR
jgi:hypothetical protein